MKPIINEVIICNIENFYQNVAQKYRHTYDYNDMRKDIYTAISSILKIENGLLRRKPIISRWDGMYMATSADRRWSTSQHRRLSPTSATRSQSTR